jgi:hypothetical protein
MATEQEAENYTVEDLVALNPYNPDILNDLEKFVNEQVNPNYVLSLLFFLVCVCVCVWGGGGVRYHFYRCFMFAFERW